MHSDHQLPPQRLAELAGRTMYARDPASQALGMTLDAIEPGYARMSMRVRDDMLNGHGSCHGGYIFMLADSAFAFACNSHNFNTVGAGCTIEYLSPGRPGDLLVAEAREQALQGRTGVYDVSVSDAGGRKVALFRGKSHRVQGLVFEPDPNQQAIEEGGTDGPAIPNPDELEPIERASRDELQALQLERLKWTLRHAYDNVPHYRAAFDEAGVHPDDLKQLSDLARFPFTQKKALRDNYPFGLFAVPREQVVRVHASSGTTGKPTVVGYTRNDIDTWAGVVARSIRAAGGRKGDLVHVSYGYGLFTGGLGAHYGAERLGCTVIPMSGGQTEKQVQLIQDFQPSIIMVTPSYMLNIVEEFARQGLDPARSSLKVGIFGAEPWTDAMRGEIEARAGIDAVDIYGLSEVMGPGVASECIESKDGPVIWEDHFYPEIIDPDTGEVLPDGAEGELVFTSLTKEALPIIRYRTRDLTRLLPPTSRSMRRMDRISGRSDDMLIIRGVNVFPSQIEELVLGMPALAPHYQLVVARDGHLDTLEVLCELREGGALAADAVDTLARELQHCIKTYVGVTTRVTLKPPQGIERTLTGKARRVIDRRPR